MAEVTDQGSGESTKLERFSGTSGRVAASIALVLALAATLVVLLDGFDPRDVVVVAVVALVAVVVWVVYLRPAIVVADEHLILHGMLTSTHLPLATVREFEVRQFVVARTDHQTYTCTALGRGRRELIRGGDKMRDPVQNFAAFVEQRVMHRADEMRATTPVAEGDQGGRVHRRVAWPEVAALVGLALAIVLLVVVI